MAEEELGIRGKREPLKLTTPYITKTDSYTPGCPCVLLGHACCYIPVTLLHPSAVVSQSTLISQISQSIGIFIRSNHHSAEERDIELCLC